MDTSGRQISVVTPVYNPGGYFPACLASLEAQTIFDQIEVVLVDDGSTDGSGALCDEFAAQHANVQVIHQPNRGLGAARNAGIDASTGAWILFLDSDDELVPDACERLLAVAESSGAGLVRGTFAHRGPLQGVAAKLAAQGPIPMCRYLRCVLSEGSYGLSPCLYLYRRALIRERGIRFAAGVAWEEQQWLMQVLLANPSVQITDCGFYVYNVGDHPSLSTKVTAKHLMDAIDAIYAAIGELESANPPQEIREVAEAFIANSIAMNAWTYFSRAPKQVRELARLRMDERYAHYAAQTQLLPSVEQRIGPALVSSSELYEEELGRIREARRKALEAQEAAKAQAEEEKESPSA